MVLSVNPFNGASLSIPLKKVQLGAACLDELVWPTEFGNLGFADDGGAGFMHPMAIRLGDPYRSAVLDLTL